ncbi:hypothetical protein [Dactylosporangium sp. NPDC051541]|uniref:hypothetical protein n=1 Tax=Dactylosporangium sp. NPDC051541 TaxID=3363977 RepID=UPI0037B2A7FC
MDKFWDALGGKLAERWLSVAVPALVFWLGGLTVWAAGRGWFGALRRPLAAVATLPVGAQLLGVGALLLAVAASGWVVNQAVAPALRLAQGYGPLWRPWRDRLARRFARRFDALGTEFAALAPVIAGGGASADQRQRYTRITHEQRLLPGPGRFLPTRVGNILRAAESHPVDRYGLDVVTVWPHLWLLLPELVRAELVVARAGVNAAAAAGLWGVLFAAFTPWSWWALPIGLGVAAACWFVWLPARAEGYSALVQATVDLHRGELYAKLRWPVPENPADERLKGRRLSTYLARGLSGTTPTFHP